MLFRDLGLAEPLLRALDEEGFAEPTPIQAGCIPLLTAGRDLVGIAQTGTGKTAAFVLPLLQRALAIQGRPARKTCRALILAPTRELAGQIIEALRLLGRHLHVSTTLVVGGVKYEPQIRGLNRGVDVVVSTPGRLLDHLETGAVTLDDCQVVVLDEADQMLDMGFLPAMRQILSKTPAGRQTILLSATMPDAIRQLARDVLNDPAEISVAPAATPIERISQQILHVDMGAKSGLIADLLADRAVERAIVFTRTKRGADRVSLTLQKAGLTAAAIHGDKSQSQRDKALKLFKTGTVRILVATDVAARGIDVPDVSHVVNYDLPNVPEAYVHRIGRTARAGREGVALSFCDETELDYLRDIEKLIGSSIWSESLRKDKRTPKVGVKPPPRGKRPQGQNSQGPNAQSKKPQGQKFQGQKPQGQKPQGQKSSGAKYRGRTRAA